MTNSFCLRVAAATLALNVFCTAAANASTGVSADAGVKAGTGVNASGAATASLNSGTEYSINIGNRVIRGTIEFCAACAVFPISEEVVHGALRLYHQFRQPLGKPVVVYDYTANHTFVLALQAADPSQSGLSWNLKVLGTFISSGGRGGVSNRVKSGGTPQGVHFIYRKQGHGFLLGQTFDAGKYGFFETQIVPTTGFEDWTSDFVLTRILRLRGLEGSLNNNSDARKILFHGTPEEGFLGFHESAGCIRLSNTDVVTLFNLVEEGTLVNIVARDHRPRRVARHLLVSVDELKRPELRKIRR